MVGSTRYFLVDQHGNKHGPVLIDDAYLPDAGGLYKLERAEAV